MQKPLPKRHTLESTRCPIIYVNILKVCYLYCFANVGRYVRPPVRPSVRPSLDQMVSDHCLKNYLWQSFHISYMYVSVRTRTLLILGQKSRSQWSILKKKCFPLIILRIFYYKPYIFQMLNGLGENKTCIYLC